MIFIMKPDRDQMEFKVGRGHDSDIRVSDISVSRFHARIRYQDGKFLLEDNTSKFGTLVGIKERTPIIKNHTCAVQCGRTVVTYMLKSADFLRQAQMQSRGPILQSADPQELKREYKQEEQNLSRLASSAKNEQIPLASPNMRHNFYFREGQTSNRIPPVPENILRGDMEEEERDENDQSDQDEQ
jgi:hypothetical protein